jgi:magnesium chelatase family protein
LFERSEVCTYCVPPLKNSGFRFPADKRITVNLAPAELRHEGPACDLPIAVGVLAATN